jgi:hypothetical protein
MCDCDACASLRRNSVTLFSDRLTSLRWRQVPSIIGIEDGTVPKPHSRQRHTAAEDTASQLLEGGVDAAASVADAVAEPVAPVGGRSLLPLPLTYVTLAVLPSRSGVGVWSGVECWFE